MPHPTLGLPPRDVTAGLPDAAARLRANRRRLARIALQTTVHDTVDFTDRYDDTMLRLFVRDYESHIEQLAKSLETGDEYYVVAYSEWLVPVYRRRRVPTRDFMALLRGLEQAAASVLTPAERDTAAELFKRWAEKLKFHQRLPGDHKGNSLIRFFWKGAGIGDDKWI
jgi:hypothetical protein